LHEYSIALSLLRMIEERAPKPGKSRAVRVELRIGEQSGVEIELLETAWKQAKVGTLCAESALAIERIEAVWACALCGRAIGNREIKRCPDCDVAARLRGGDELVLDRVEFEIES
jgi:hydrogenase nickel insertion protein HypA